MPFISCSVFNLAAAESSRSRGLALLAKPLVVSASDNAGPCSWAPPPGGGGGGDGARELACRPGRHLETLVNPRRRIANDIRSPAVEHKLASRILRCEAETLPREWINRGKRIPPAHSIADSFCAVPNVNRILYVVRRAQVDAIIQARRWRVDYLSVAIVEVCEVADLAPRHRGTDINGI